MKIQIQLINGNFSNLFMIFFKPFSWKEYMISYNTQTEIVYVYAFIKIIKGDNGADFFPISAFSRCLESLFCASSRPLLSVKKPTKTTWAYWSRDLAFFLSEDFLVRGSFTCYVMLSKAIFRTSLRILLHWRDRSHTGYR